VGLLPEHIRATPDGCTAVTSNVDSCDYAVIDVSTMINGALPPSDMGTSVSAKQEANVVRRIVAAVPDGKGGARVLAARPKWLEIAPDSTDAVHGYETKGTPGQCSVQTDDQGQVHGLHKAWVALPNCELLIKLNLNWTPGMCPSADGGMVPEDPTHPCNPTVEQAIKITKSGAQVVTDLSTLSCPGECAGLGDASSTAAPPPPVDAGVSDMGSPPPFNATQGFPGTIAIDRTGGRMIVGDLYSQRIDIIPVDAQGKLGTPRNVQLEVGSGAVTGVTVVRVSPRMFAGQFVYAIARDNTVRVIDLDREVECETNPDPRFVGNGINLQAGADFDFNQPPPDPLPMARQLGCFPLNDPTRPNRAWYATSPGIQLNPGQLPKDVVFVHVDQPPGSTTNQVAPPPAAPGLLVGDFAWIMTSDGRGTLVDIYDGCPQPNQQDLYKPQGPFTTMCSLANVTLSRQQTQQLYGHPTPLLLDRVAHHLRSGHLRFVSSASAADPVGMARVSDEFNAFSVSVPSTSVVADAGVPNSDAGASPNLPGLYQEPLPKSVIQLTDTAPTRAVRFVDPDRAHTEIWSLAWEGLLPGTARTLGQWMRGGYLQDSGGAWCSHGVLKHDKLIYTGCTQDGDCDYTQQCVRDPSAPSDVLNGLCLETNTSNVKHPNPKLTVDYWSQQCGLLLKAQRKYRILSAKVNVPLPGAMPVQTDMGPIQPQTTSLLQLAEIYEPEYTQQTRECNSDDDCSLVTVAPASGPSGGLPTRCLPDWDGQKRCLVRCEDGDDPNSTTPRCGPDFECARSGTYGDKRCMRAPLDDKLFATCFPELQSYEIVAGDVFTVTGLASGFNFNEAPDATGECQKTSSTDKNTSEYVRLRQSRVPLQPPDACVQLLSSGEKPPASPLDSIDSSKLNTNVCYMPQAMDQLSTQQIVHFENGVFNIAVTIPTVTSTFDPLKPPAPLVVVPPDGTVVGLNITGGGAPLAAPLGVDVQAEDPTFAVVGPDQQTVYIVDGGKTAVASGLRGQLLRLYTPTQTVDHLFVIR
jgi:hypothetical protein